MKNEDIIKQLSANLKPVKPQSSTKRIIVQMILIAIAAIVFILSILKAHNLSQGLNIGFFIDSILGISLFTISIYVSAQLRKPSFKYNDLYLFMIITILSLFVLNHLSTIAYDIRHSLNISNIIAIECIKTNLISSILVISAYYFLFKPSAIIRPYLTGFILSTASFSVGLLLINAHCTIQNNFHILFSHLVVPFLIISTVQFFVSKKVFSW